MAGLLAASILATSLATENALYGFGQALKLVIILVVILPLLLTQPSLAKAGFSAAPAAVWANLALLFLGMTINPVFASVMASDDRWGTFFNLPGSLWRLGVLVLVSTVYTLHWRRRLYYWMLLAASLGLILADGARTGAFVGMLSVIYVGYLSFIERRSRLAAVLVLGVLGFGVILLVTTALYGSDPTISLLPPRVIEAVKEFFVGGLESVDLDRFQMLQYAWQRIAENPFWGTGIGTTRLETHQGLMVVHNAYLQVWADLGLLGLFAYVGLVWGWLLWFPRFLSQMRQQTDPVLRGLYYNAAFLLFYFAVSLLFNPLSTEWSEWITFVVPYALYAEALRIPKSNEHPFQRRHRYA